MFTLADHCCIACLGRVLERIDEAGQRHARCADCGHEAEGGAEAICCCNAIPTKARIRLQCIRNPARSAEVPHEIVIIERPAAPTSYSKGGGNRVGGDYGQLTEFMA